MQPKFTPKVFRAFCMRIFAMTLVLVSFTKASYSQVLFNEGFTTVIPAGWAQQNLSTPAGTNPLWFQGNAGVFPAQNGATTSYAACNFNSVAGANTISNWLFAPTITLKNGDIFTFYTRKVAPDAFPDRLQVRMSTNGASVNVGATNVSVGDFTTLLLDINPTLITGVYPIAWTQYSITISGLGGPTSGRLAFRYFVTNGGPAGANSDYIGVDNAVYTTFAAPCSGTPDPGNTISSANPVCTGINFTLSLQNNPAVSGLTYQWQSSTAGIGGPYGNIGGATSSTLTTNQAVATWFRCNVTCGANTGTSIPLPMTMNLPSACYCTPVYTNGCTLGDFISNVTLGTLNNSSTCSTPPFTYYSAVPAPTLIQGATYPLTVSVGPDVFGQYVRGWIDYNQDGAFSATETLGVSGNAGPNGTVTITFTVPAGVLSLLGTTRLRVRGGDDAAPSATQACGPSNSTYGEAEDYNVTIAPCLQGVFTTQPVSTSIQCGANVTFTAAATGSALSYQWEQRIPPSTVWTAVTNTGVFSGATTNTLTLSGVPSTMNGYQYRGLISGPCTAVDFSNVATLTVTPLVATVSPTSATICTGSIQQLSLTNSTSPTTVSFTNNISLPIPDNTPAGVFSTIAVSGIPAGAIITNVSVTLNITHTYVGDLEITMRAPNLALLNLVGELNGGTGSNSTDDFVNTVISSTGTTPLSGAPAPRTGTFAADRLQGYGPSGAYQTAPNGVSWNTMTSIMNGNWVLGLSDWYAFDAGTLNNWTISITYGAAAAGIWTQTSPLAPNSMFTDPGASIAYTGTLTSTIYVKPLATAPFTGNSATYCVVYSTTSPACTSAPTCITVNVTNPIVGLTVAPASNPVCLGSTATFTALTTSGGPLTYQWQVSIDGGVTWNNISGATAATLNVSGVTQSMNNNRYRVIVTAAPCGSATSAAATLTVNPLPVVTISSANLTLTPGQTTTITASSVPAAAAGSWSWTLNGVPVVPPVTTNTITVGIDALGDYQARVTDVNGCVNTSNILTVSATTSDKLWIYPNPTTGQFQVRLFYAGTPSGSQNEIRIVSIYNSQGALILTKRFVLNNSSSPYLQMNFDLSNAASGTYMVKVAHELTGKIVSGGLVKFNK